jgi:tetratricopeptide (TPR) repeat protein
MGAKKWLNKAYYIVGSLVIAGAIINFSSRGAWLAVLLSLFFMGVLVLVAKTEKKVFWGLLLALAGFTGVLALSLNLVRPGSLSFLLKASDANMELRFFAWDISMEMVQKYPVLGYGPGSVQNYFERFRGPNLARQSGVFDDAHNVFLQTAATTGLPFALLFICLLGLSFLRGWKMLGNEQRVFWAIAAMASMFGWCVAAAFTPVPTVCFLFLALVISGFFVESDSSKFVVDFFGFNFLTKVVGTAFLAVSLAFLASEFIFYQALTSYYRQDWKSVESKTALAKKINPTNQLFSLYGAAGAILRGASEQETEQLVMEVLSYDPKSGKSQVMAANLYFLQYDKTQEKKYLEKAIKNMENSLGVDKYTPGRYTHLGFYYAQGGQLSNAKEALKVALSLDDKSVPAWLLLARIYQLENRPEQVLFALNGAKEAAPENAQLKALAEWGQDKAKVKQLPIPALIDIFNIEP